MKSSGQRPALAVGLAASVAFHAAVLAFVAIEIPAAETPEIRLAPPAVLSPVEPDPEPAPQVVVIRPPGVMPSGGSEGTRGGEPDAPGHRPPPAGRTVSDAPPSTPAPRTAPVVRTVLALAAPVAEAGVPVLEGVRDSVAATPETRPGRGIILRTGPSSAGTGGGAVTGSGGAGGPGGLSTGGGVATVGPGGDCITPGLAGPGDRRPTALPGRAERPGAGSPRPGGSSRGRGGRPGS